MLAEKSELNEQQLAQIYVYVGRMQSVLLSGLGKSFFGLRANSFLN